MAKRTKKLSRPQLKLEALEQRQLLAGVTGGGTEVGSNINHSNGNVYDQVLMTGSSVTITADAGQVTRVSFLDLQGDIVQAEFSGKGSLTISLDQFTKDVAPAQYNQAGVKYSQGLASFTVSGSDSSTNFAVFSVGKGNAVNQALFDTTHQGGDHIADIARLTIVADPANPNGSDFGAIYAGNAKFSADSGVVGITASNVQVQNAVRIGDVDAKTSATPTLVFGTHSQFAAIDVGGGDLISTNGKAINNNGSYEYGVNLLAGTDSSGTTLPAQVVVPPFTAHDPFAGTSAKTLSLTVGNDVGSSFLGTAGDDTYIAAIGGNGTPTNGTSLNAGDSLNGGGGNDTLSLSISGTNTANQTTASFTANNIEWLSIANFQTDDAFNSIIDLAGVPQIKGVTINSSSASGDTSLSSVQNLVTATLKNGSGDLAIGYAAGAVSGTADEQSLTLAGQTGGTFTTNGIETVNIASTTGTNTITVSDSALAADRTLSKIVITGDKGLVLGTLETSVKTVDASALTAGSLTLTGTQAVKYSVKGGAGDDTVTLASFDADDTVIGGAGSDTLSIDNAGGTEGIFKNVSEVEKVTLTGAGTLTLKDNVGPTSFDLTNAAVQVLTLDKSLTTTYTNATTVTLGAGDKVTNPANVALTVNVKDTNLTATTITGGSGADVVNLTTDGAGATNLFTNAVITNVETINVLGSSNATYTLHNSNVASGKALTIDGSTASGNLTINGAAESDGTLKITGGSGADTLTAGSKGSDTLIGGAGNDTLVFGELKATNVATGGDGSDTLSVTGTDIDASSKFAGVTGVETLKLGNNVDVTLDAPLTATAGIATIDASDTSANVITLKSGYTDAVTVKLTGSAATDKIDNQANVELTVNANAGDILAGTSIWGGSGTDVLNLKADAATATTTNVKGVEKIVIVQDTVTPTNGATVVMGNNTNQVAAGKTMVVDASALTDSGAVFTFTGTDTETDGFVSVTGGAGADVLKGTGSGFDTLIGGAGNDAITITALSATNTIDGGAGSDSLTVTSNITTSSQFLGVTNIETLKLGATTAVTLTSNIKSSTGISSIDATAGGAGANVITLTGGYTDATSVKINAGDSVVNTDANVALTVNALVAELTAGTTVTGGKNADTLKLDVNGGGTATLTNVSGVETVTMVKPSAGAAAATVVIGGATTVASGKTMTIDGSALATTLTVDASALNSTINSGSVSVIGGSANDTITGGVNADIFTGGDGDDVFTLDKHANKLTFDTITDLKTGDVLKSTDTGNDTFVAAKLTLGGLASFSDYLDAAATNGTTTDDANATYRWFQFNNNTYIVRDTQATNTFVSNKDMVIEIKGLVDLNSSNGPATTNNDGTLTIKIG